MLKKMNNQIYAIAVERLMKQQMIGQQQLSKNYGLLIKKF